METRSVKNPVVLEITGQKPAETDGGMATQMITVTIPVKTVSEANSHTHWRERQKRAKAQRWAATNMVRADLFGYRFRAMTGQREDLVLTLTRIAPRKLDSDNLAGSCKHVRDGIADALGIDDGDERLDWRYAQEKGKPGEYAVRVEIRAKAEAAA